MDLIVMLKERQQHKFVLERELKAAEAAPVRKGVRPNLRKTFVLMPNDEENVKSDSPVAEGKRSLQATADFEKSCNATGVTAKKVDADPEGQWTKDVPETRDLGLVGEVGQSEKLRDITEEMQKGNLELHASCAAEKATRARRLLEVSALWVESAA